MLVKSDEANNMTFVTVIPDFYQLEFKFDETFDRSAPIPSDRIEPEMLVHKKGETGPFLLISLVNSQIGLVSLDSYILLNEE